MWPEEGFCSYCNRKPTNDYWHDKGCPDGAHAAEPPPVDWKARATRLQAVNEGLVEVLKACEFYLDDGRTIHPDEGRTRLVDSIRTAITRAEEEMKDVG
jgi:hypothetical protein